MGSYDTVTVDDERFVCSEGHDLCKEEFQTKDLGCTMGAAKIGPEFDGPQTPSNSYGARICLTIESGEWGQSPCKPFLGVVYVYCHCTKCPAFVQAGTGNLAATKVEFEVEVNFNAIRSITRISPSTADLMTYIPKQPYMAGCEGPMTYEAACKRHVEYPQRRSTGALVADLSANVLDALWSPSPQKSQVKLGPAARIDLGRPIDDTIPAPERQDAIRKRYRGRRFAFGAPQWPGVAKLNEECGEVSQIIGKIMNFDYDSVMHWDGTNLRDELMKEMGDLQAAITFVTKHCDLDAEFIAERARGKLALFEKWHIEQADDPEPSNQTKENE